MVHLPLLIALLQTFSDFSRSTVAAWLPILCKMYRERFPDCYVLSSSTTLSAKLELAPGQRILDIGCGWGGLAFELAARADVEVLGVTLSKEQQLVATKRAQTRGLDKRVRFELLDYRKVSGPFDRIVSVGMFEHVGVSRYEEFFKNIFALLENDGFALLHSIGHMSPPGTASPWLRKYIFPGAYSPALSEVLAATERQHLWVNDIEVLRTHYADTLVEWNKRFQHNRKRIAELYDERFCRMWEFLKPCSGPVRKWFSRCSFHLPVIRHRFPVIIWLIPSAAISKRTGQSPEQ